MESFILGKHIIHLETVNSTNNYALEALKSGKAFHGSLISAEFQESGKGQRSNSWESSPGKNLLLSYVIQPKNLVAEKSFELNFISALAVIDLLSELAPDAKAHIKWPNDIMLNHKKVAGILIENALQSNKLKHSIIGIGINVNQQTFASDFATSISNETDSEHTLAKGALILNAKLSKWYTKMSEGKIGEILTAYNSKLWKRGKVIQAKLNNDQQQIKILDVDRFGLIHIKTKHGFLKAELGELKINYE